MNINPNELVIIKGGAYSASWLNYITRGVTVLFEMGRAVGSSLRRLFLKKYC